MDEQCRNLKCEILTILIPETAHTPNEKTNGIIKRPNDMFYIRAEPWINGECVFAVGHAFQVNTMCSAGVVPLALLSEKSEACCLPLCLFFQALNLVFRHNKRNVGLVSFGPLLAP